MSEKTQYLTNQTDEQVGDDWGSNADDGVDDIISWQEWQEVDNWWDGLGDGRQKGWIWVQELLKAQKS